MKLSVSGIVAGYAGSPVLQGVSLDVDSGDRVALVGRNGAGKSTLLRTVVGQLRCQQGRILIDGTDVTKLPCHERARLGVGYVPQGRQVFTKLSVLDNVRVAARASGRRGWRGRVDDALFQFPLLRERLHMTAGQLSGGQQQMLALARALATGPRVLLLDEPTEGIQPSLVQEIAEHVISLNAERGITVVVVEQNLEFATRVGRRAHVMAAGAVAHTMAAADLLDDREIHAAYLGV